MSTVDDAIDTPSSREKISQVLEQIRPAIQSDGGDVELLKVTPDGVVQVRLHGACVGCPESELTLKTLIKSRLQRAVPGVTDVQAVGE